MKESISSDYDVWSSIDYTPVINQVDISRLYRYLHAGQSVLDVGCGKGENALELASLGFAATGIDINSEAIEIARQAARDRQLDERATFCVADGCEFNNGPFDAVIAVRLLTCLPKQADWKRVLRQIHRLTSIGGLVYVNDFARSDRNPVYSDRYAAGRLAGLRDGDFTVQDDAGEFQFIAHHHSQDEIMEIASGYEPVDLQIYESISMNGNQCRMFEFIGRKLDDRPN